MAPVTPRLSGLLRSVSRPSQSRVIIFHSSPLLITRSRCLNTESSQTSTQPPPPPPPSSSSNPKINQIVDDISGLTLLQAADLVTLLKSRLNIQEIAMPTAAPAASSTSGATIAAAEPSEEAKPKEKTIFSVKLESFEAASKPKIIKEVKAMNPTLTLIEAKKFVDSVPKVLKENLPKEEAEKMKKVFEALGAVVVLD